MSLVITAPVQPRLEPKKTKKITTKKTDEIIQKLKADRRNYSIIKQMQKERWQISVSNWERLETIIATIF